MPASAENRTAIWVITPNGRTIAHRITKYLPDADLYLSDKISPGRLKAARFNKLSDALAERFLRYKAHIFIMATGIVVRMIAPFIQNKFEDPAVVVVDDQGRHAISLLAGHLGGANELTCKIAEMLQADPVISTATDVNAKPAIDVLAKERKLTIENPSAIKTVNMALLTGRPICVHDPLSALRDNIPKAVPADEASLLNWEAHGDSAAAIYVGDRQLNLGPNVLILRPATLVAGIGCNRHTSREEMEAFLHETFRKYRLAESSLERIATIDLKTDETGLVKLADSLKVPIDFFSRQALNGVQGIRTPSARVEKHIGVKSVCEAAAILASQMGPLIVPKQTAPNVTVAVARKAFTLSEPDPAAPII
jgi:cobalt-precorrin 5A hydrolase